MRWACRSPSTRPRCAPHGSTACPRGRWKPSRAAATVSLSPVWCASCARGCLSLYRNRFPSTHRRDVEDFPSRDRARRSQPGATDIRRKWQNRYALAGGVARDCPACHQPFLIPAPSGGLVCVACAYREAAAANSPGSSWRRSKPGAAARGPWPRKVAAAPTVSARCSGCYFGQASRARTLTSAAMRRVALVRNPKLGQFLALQMPILFVRGRRNVDQSRINILS